MPSPHFLPPSPLTTPTPVCNIKAGAEPLQTPLQEFRNDANTNSGQPHAGQRLKEDHFQVKHPRYSDVHEDDGASLNTTPATTGRNPINTSS
jgi:hypothetical protein